jgi:pSer/pThr/pTyr-binding forkhead associated (FHA) protein
MKKSRRAKLELMEGRSFILGREGHIYIDSPTASKHHAEIRIKDGKIYLRDLKSTNGTFLIKNKTLVQFDEGYVKPAQSIVIGKKVYVIEDLLAIASDFVGVDDNTTHVDLSARSESAAAPDPELPKEAG